MRLTGCCAKVVMGVWSREVKRILKEAEISLWLACGFVDDVRFLTSVIEKGRKWSKKEKSFIYKSEWEEVDKSDGKSDEDRTSTEIEHVMNSVFQNIQFEKDIAEQFSGNRLPTLDFEMWLADFKEDATEGEARPAVTERKAQACIELLAQL